MPRAPPIPSSVIYSPQNIWGGKLPSCLINFECTQCASYTSEKHKVFFSCLTTHTVVRIASNDARITEQWHGNDIQGNSWSNSRHSFDVGQAGGPQWWTHHRIAGPRPWICAWVLPKKKKTPAHSVATPFASLSQKLDGKYCQGAEQNTWSLPCTLVSTSWKRGNYCHHSQLISFVSLL